MKLLEVKTIRFAFVVEKAGTPEVYTLWQKQGEIGAFKLCSTNIA